ncbi:fungal-specific transcription factor domain-containing protein [Melampsora americana]|nr:fungal-specific transcription factor domain-containing protein [Melampsora americana]
MLKTSQSNSSIDQSAPNLTFTSAKRKRAANACIRCRTRKQRCDGLSIPCANCAKSRAQCIFPEDASGEHLLREHISVLESRISDLTVALREVTSVHASIPENRLSRQETPKVVPTGTGTEDAKKNDMVDEDDLVNGIGFLSLSSGAEPLYVGGSSGASWGRIFSSVLRRSTGSASVSGKSLIPSQPLPDPPTPTEQNSSRTRSSSSSGCSDSSSSSVFPFRIPLHIRPKFLFPLLPTSKSISNEIFVSVYSTIQSRYGFMNFALLRVWHEQRDVFCGSQEVQKSHERTAAFFLWLTYAIGVRLLEGRGKAVDGLASHEHYFQAALQYFDHVQSNITTIQALLFLAMYSFRSEKGLSAWHLSGLALRTAIELGLHRKSPLNKPQHPWEEETRKRVWWSVYCLERTMALQLGRPIAIQDKDIDVPLPLDIDCFVTDGDKIRERATAIETALRESNTTLENRPYPLGITSMSSSLHHIRLRQILTKVKETVYDHQRDKSTDVFRKKENLGKLVEELNTWKNNSPKWHRADEDGEPADPGDPGHLLYGLGNEVQPEEGEMKEYMRNPKKPPYVYDWFDLQYALQLLLIPYSLTASRGDPYLHQAVIAAMQSCELQNQRVKRRSSSPLSIYMLHKLFMAGIFLLWALDKDPEVILMLEKFPESQKSSTKDPHSNAHDNPIASCSRALWVYAEHYPEVKTYSECFDQLVLDRKEIWKDSHLRKSCSTRTQHRRGSPYPNKTTTRLASDKTLPLRQNSPMRANSKTNQPNVKFISPLVNAVHGAISKNDSRSQDVNGSGPNLTHLLQQNHGLDGPSGNLALDIEQSDPRIACHFNYEELDMVECVMRAKNLVEKTEDHLPDEGHLQDSSQPSQSISRDSFRTDTPSQEAREMYPDFHYNLSERDRQIFSAHDERNEGSTERNPDDYFTIPTPKFQEAKESHEGCFTHCHPISNYQGSLSEPYLELHQLDSAFQNPASTTLDEAGFSALGFPSTQSAQMSYTSSLLWGHHQRYIQESNSGSQDMKETFTQMIPPFGSPGTNLRNLGYEYSSTSHRPDSSCLTSTASNTCEPSTNLYTLSQDQRNKDCMEGVDRPVNKHVKEEPRQQVYSSTEPVSRPHSAQGNALLMSFNTLFAASQSSQHPFLGGMGDVSFWNALQDAAATEQESVTEGDTESGGYENVAKQY